LSNAFSQDSKFGATEEGKEVKERGSLERNRAETWTQTIRFEAAYTREFAGYDDLVGFAEHNMVLRQVDMCKAEDTTRCVHVAN
jgi:hypothetical protein